MRAVLLSFCLVLTGCTPLSGGRWESEALARQEARLGQSPHRLRDPALEAWLADWVRRIDPVHGVGVRVYVLDLPAPQAELLGENVLRVRLGLLLALQHEAELAFVLAHELGHRRLGHVDERKTHDWDAQAAERAADRAAVEAVVRLGYPASTGSALLRRLREKVERPKDRALIDARIAALESLPSAPTGTPVPDPRFHEVLAPYRTRP